MNPHLYDLLDVDEAASEAEIRAAWKASVADLDPTDRRFRVYNDAAAVLLDADKRAEYDARLAAERAEEAEPAEASDATGAGEERVEAEESDAAVDTTDADDAVAADTDADDDADEDADDAADEDADATTPGAESALVPSDAPGPSPLLLWIAAALAVLAVAGAAWVLTLPGVRADESPQDAAAAAAQLRATGAEVQTVATEEIVPLLGYDYRTMDEDLTRIQSKMTEAMGDRQAASWEALTEEAKAQRVVVTARAPYVALTRLSEDGDRATVVAFIDQDVTKRGVEPFTLRMWATLTLVESDGEWLLDDICTQGDCA